MKKICFILEINNTHSKRWVKYFASKGYEILVLSDSEPNETIANVKIIKPEMNLLTNALAFKIFPKPYGNESFKWIPYKKHIKQFNPDIVHAMEALAFGYTLSKIGNYKKILTPWGNDVFYDPFHSRWAKHLVTKGLNAADIITTNHPGIDNYLYDTFNIPKDKVKGFSWGIDTKIFHSHKKEKGAELRKRLHIPKDAPVIVSNRKLAAYWGVGHIVDSVPEVLKQHPDAHYIFIRGGGEEVYLNKMKSFIFQNGAEKNVRFIDENLTPEEMSVLLNLADIFVSVTYTDMLSISILEGMACGAIPVVGNLEAYKTRIKDGENGFYVPVRTTDKIVEKLNFILKNLHIKPKISDINRDIIDKNDNMEICSEKMHDIYLELLNKK